MKAFEESEDYLFFGRNREIEELLKKFSANRFLAVIGSSGSGKSSLVKSGMLPAIYGGFMKSGSNWRVALMQPGENPIGYLARELAREGVLYSGIENSEIPYESVIESRLRRSENGIVHVCSDAHLPANENLLIVVDQFEELFRFSKYEKDNKLGKSDAMHFIQILLNASVQQEFPVYILLTMRSDFLGDCAEFRGLPEAINNGQYLVPRMTRDGIREAITGPVAVSNASISQRLVTRLLNDINNDTDQLPVLQHAMMRTWDAWYKRSQHDTPIDFGDYEKIGTMKSALSQHADEAYAELSTEKEKHICELMFKALTDKSADIRGIRRPRSITDLCILTKGSQAEIRKQVEIFRKPGRTFLMPPADIDLKDDTIIDISHESLMRIWQRLVNWTDEEARSGDLYMRLANSAQLKKTNQRGLLKDPELGIALLWKENNQPSAKWAEGFNTNFDEVMAYLEESRVKDLEEKKLIAQKEATRKRLVKIIFGILGLLVVAGFIASFIFKNKTNIALAAQAEAEKAKNEALQSELSAMTAKKKAEQSDSLAQIEKNSALKEQKRADSSAIVAGLEKNKAITSAAEEKKAKDIAESKKKEAERLQKEALENGYKNAPSEYARLIREGPSEKRKILKDTFDYKLAAYTVHLDNLRPLIAGTHDQGALVRYNNLQDRLYYNNDLYEKIYKCMENTTDTGVLRKVFRIVSARKEISGKIEEKDPAFISINNELKKEGKRLKFLLKENPKDQRVIAATDDNWIYVYPNKNSVNPEPRGMIPMGAQINALDYNPEKKIIYFGLESGNIGYIKYKEDKKNQPVFENILGTPVVAIQLFKARILGDDKFFLLAAGKKSRAVVYKLDENTLEPDKNLFGNNLPVKNLGNFIDAKFDGSKVLITGQSARSASLTYYSWNPFTALVLEEYKLHKKISAELLNSTNIYNNK